MKKFLRPMLALSLITLIGLGTESYGAETAFGNASYGSQTSYDSFNFSVRKRLESVRIGSVSQSFGSPFRSSGGGYNDTYNSGYAPNPGATGGGYNQNPAGYNPGYNQGYNQGYNPGYDPGAGSNSGYNPGFGPNPGYSGSNMNANYAPGNGYSYGFSSEEAYAMAPSSRVDSYNSARRRQLDCVYYSGFTVWTDFYQTWANQRSRGADEGYKFRTFGPAVGFDYSTGSFTIGAATTYNWGKLKGRDISHDMDLNTWGLELYGQYNSDLFYINGTLGYGHNKFKSRRATQTVGRNSDSFSSNVFNIDTEFGFKFVWSGLQVVPNVGLRYFHDRRGTINEDGWNESIHANSRNYHTLEAPIGVNVSYEINTGGMVFVPRARFAWVPELSHKRGAWDGQFTWNGVKYGSGEDAARRSRHGFQLGLGMEAKLSKSLSAHIDYNCVFRSKQYEHHWNAGMGFTF